MSSPTIPAGFELESDQAPVKLPPGFELESSRPSASPAPPAAPSPKPLTRTQADDRLSRIGSAGGQGSPGYRPSGIDRAAGFVLNAQPDITNPDASTEVQAARGAGRKPVSVRDKRISGSTLSVDESLNPANAPTSAGGPAVDYVPGGLLKSPADGPLTHRQQSIANQAQGMAAARDKMMAAGSQAGREALEDLVYDPTGMKSLDDSSPEWERYQREKWIKEHPKTAGAARATGSFAGGMVADPVSYALMGAGATGEVGGRVMAGGFAANAAKDIPEQSHQLGAIWDNPDISRAEKAEQATGLILNSLFVSQMGMHTVRPRPVAAATPLDQATQALANYERSTGNPDFQLSPEPPKPKLVFDPQKIAAIGEQLSGLNHDQRQETLISLHDRLSKQLLDQGQFLDHNGQLQMVKTPQEAEKQAQGIINDSVQAHDKRVEATVKAAEASKQEKPTTQTPQAQPTNPRVRRLIDRGKPEITKLPNSVIEQPPAMGKGMTQDSPAVTAAQQAPTVPGQTPMVAVKEETPSNLEKLNQPPKPVAPEDAAQVGTKDDESGRKVLQPSESKIQNERLASDAAPELTTALSEVSASVEGAKFDRLRPQKNLERLGEKEDHDKPPETISDYLAAQISAETPKAKDDLIAALKQKFKVVDVEDRFLEGRPDKAGYPSANVQVQLSNHVTAEVQIVPREVQEITDQSHHYYTQGREAKTDAERKELWDKAAEINGAALGRFKERNGIGEGQLLPPTATPAGWQRVGSHEELSTLPPDKRKALIDSVPHGRLQELDGVLYNGEPLGRHTSPALGEPYTIEASKIPDLVAQHEGRQPLPERRTKPRDPTTASAVRLSELRRDMREAEQKQDLVAQHEIQQAINREAANERGEHYPIGESQAEGITAEEVNRRALESVPERGNAPTPGTAGQIATRDLNFDPKRFQYKTNVNERGVTNLLAGKRYNPELAGEISVWRDPADGKLYVINGHHRAQLAVDSGQQNMRAWHIDVSTAEAARARGALQNIADGRGTAVDAAKFFRDSGMTSKDLDAEGISLGEATAANGLALSRLDPSVFEKVATGQMTEARGVAIGEATADAAQQEAIVKLIEKQEARGRKITNDTISELARFVANSGNRTVEQGGLFGANQEIHSLALEKAEASAYIKQQIAKERRTFAAVATQDRAQALSQVKGQQIKAQENAKISQDAAQAEEAYNKLSSSVGPVSNILEKAARDLASGNYKPEDIKRIAYQSVREEIRKTLSGGQEGSAQGLQGPEQPVYSKEEPRPVVPTFFSKAERVAEQKLPNNISADSVMATLKNAGVKDEELKWMGLDDFLKGKEKVSKQELLNFIRENNVQVQEVEKGGALKVEQRENGKWAVITSDGKTTAIRAREDEARAIAEEETSPTKFAAHQLPGGENYRELLLTLPDAREAFRQGINDKFLALKEASAKRQGREINNLYDERDQGRLTPEEASQLAELDAAENPHQRFRSPHFEEPNVLAHVRFNDRTDADGKKVLFVEELQSDWHQKGRKYGYIGSTPEERELQLEANRTGSIVPDAPFKSTWHELALKRMLRYAAENGYDRVAWTTGDVQNERYDLSKKVRNIEWYWNDRKAGTKIIRIAPKEGNVIELGLQPDGTATGVSGGRSGTEFDGKHITDIVGKDIGQKITTDSHGELSGDGLKVGGSGMKGFYDKIIPDFLNKYGKKWGAKVGETQIDPGYLSGYSLDQDSQGNWVAHRGQHDFEEFKTRDEADQFIRSKSQKLDAHSLDITPSMRDSVMHEGQPMFAKEWGTGMAPGELDNWIKAAGKNLRIEERGEQNTLFGAADKMYQLTNQHGERTVITESQLKSLSQKFPNLASQSRGVVAGPHNVTWDYQPPEAKSLFRPQGGTPTLTVSSEAMELMHKVAGLEDFSNQGMNISRGQAEKIAGKLSAPAFINEAATARIPKGYEQVTKSLGEAIGKASNDAGNSGVHIVMENTSEHVTREEQFHGELQRELGEGEIHRHLPEDAATRLLEHPAAAKLADELTAKGYSKDAPGWVKVAEISAKIATGDLGQLSPAEAADWFDNYLSELHQAHGEQKVSNLVEVLHQKTQDIYNEARQRINARETPTRPGPGEGEGRLPQTERSLRENQQTGPPEKTAGQGNRTDAAGAPKEAAVEEPLYSLRDAAIRVKDLIHNPERKANEEAAAKVDDGLFKLKQQKGSDVLEAAHVMRETPTSPEQQERVFHYGEVENYNGKNEALLASKAISPEDKLLYESVVKPLKDITDQERRELKAKGAPIEDSEGNNISDSYMHRAVEGKSSQLQRASNPDARGSGVGNVLRTSAASAKGRTMMGLEDENGNRAVVSIKSNRVTQWENNRQTDLGGLRNGLTTKFEQLDERLEPVGKRIIELQDKIKNFPEEVRTQATDKINRQIADLEKQRDTLNTVRGRAIGKDAIYGKEVTHNQRARITEQIDALERQRDKIEGNQFSPMDGSQRRQFRKMQDDLKKVEADRDRIVDQGPRPSELANQVWKDKNGTEWKIVQSTVKEIEQHTDTRYYKNALASTLTDFIEVRSALRAQQHLENMLTSPEAAATTFKSERGAVPPDPTWRMTQVPQLRGYYFEPHTAEVLDRFYDKIRGSGGSKVEAFSRLVSTSILFNPLVHVANVGVHWAVEKGAVGWLNPTRWPARYRSGIQAIKDVFTQGDNFQAMLRAGAPLMSHQDNIRQINQLFYETLAGRAARDSKVRDFMADYLGINSINVVKDIYQLARKTTWLSNDFFFLQSMYEKQARGMTLEQSITETAKHIPDYRIPTRVLKSSTLSKAMQLPLVSMFSAYHFGQVASYGRMVKEIFGRDRSMGERAKGVDHLLALGLVALVAYPLIDKALKQVTGDKDARMRRAGAASIPDALIQVQHGKREPADVLTSVFTPSVLGKTATEFAYNRDLHTGEKVFDRHDTPGHIAGDIGTKLTSMLGPVQQYQRFSQQEEPGKKFAWSLAGVTFPKSESRSTAQQIMMDLVKDDMPPLTPERRREMEERKQRLADGHLTQKERKRLEQKANESDFEYYMPHLELRQMRRVYKDATPEERKTILPIMQEKAYRMVKLDMTEADRLAVEEVFDMKP